MAACLAPEFEGELDAFLAGDGPDAYTGTILAMSDYHARLSEWLGWRLSEAGMSAEDRLQLAMGALNMEEGAESFLASKTRFMDIFPIVIALGDAKDSGDRNEICGNFVDLTALYCDLAENAAAQTAEFERLVNIEAARLGISLEE